MSREVKLGITLGDPGGIGPEVILSALSDPAVRRRVNPLIIGDFAVCERIRRTRKISLKLHPVTAPELTDSPRAPVPVWSVAPPLGPRRARGSIGPVTARAMIQALEVGTDLARVGIVSALVTGPLPKAAFRLAGLPFSGHTEFLAERTGTREYAMMFVGGNLRIILATIHVPLARVPGLLTRGKILGKLRLADRELRRRFGIRRARIAVTGLNPHAGEDGLLGREEIRVIRPAVAAARREGIRAEGPYPADALFGRIRVQEFDAVLAMYHDQGLAPFKALHFDTGVNVTLGLPFVRTSPDHGTARDIAGKGIASPESMKQAILLAAKLAKSSSK